MMRSLAAHTLMGVSLLALAACSGAAVQGVATNRVQDALHEDVIVNADMWTAQPEILGAGLGFVGIQGVPGLTLDDLEASERLARLAGGAWNTVSCSPDEEPTLANYTAVATPESIESIWGAPTYYADGYPIEFSWPVLPSSLDASDFLLTLNTGEQVQPEVASVYPNWELNERSTVVIFGHFGNRLPPESPGLIWPVSLEIVDSENPLQLLGPEGPVSAVGLTFTSPPPSSYTDPDVAPIDRGGPNLVAAKLTRMSTEGEGWPEGPKPLLAPVPNDGVALYGPEAEYRLRIFTSGGMTPDGVRGLLPTDYEKFFRIKAIDDAGEEILIAKVGEDYSINGRTVRVLGLADLGLKQDTYTDCYVDDRDNQIDIVLTGDDDAVRAITAVEIPSTEGYLPLYNPGGPGNDPTSGVLYAAGTPPISQDVWVTLDNPMTVSVRD